MNTCDVTGDSKVTLTVVTTHSSHTLLRMISLPTKLPNCPTENTKCVSFESPLFYSSYTNYASFRHSAVCITPCDELHGSGIEFR